MTHDDDLATIWGRIADRLGDRPALIADDRTITWAEFDERAARFSAALSTLGCRPGSVVAIDMYNCPEFLEVFFAAIRGGFVPTMVNYRYRANELVHLLTDSGAEVVVADPALAGSVRAVAERLPALRTIVELGEPYEALVAGHAPASRSSAGGGWMLSYTGGTTGLPKGVVYDMARLAGQALRTRALVCEIASDDSRAPVDAAADLAAAGRLPVCCPASPLMHSTAFTFVSVPALTAGGAIVTPANHRFDAHLLLDAFERHAVTATAIVGDAFGRPLVTALDERLAAGRPFDASHLRALCSAGVAFSADTKRRLFEHVPELTIVDACGSTEGATYGSTVLRRGDDLATARFHPAVGTIVVDEQRRPVPDGDVGLISALTVTSGYWNQPERTAATFYSRDGEWRVIPGDNGRIEPDGTITLLGRGSTVINTGGEKVHPEEVEDVIKSIAGVVDVIVVAVPDERLGSVVGAVVQPAAGAGLTEAGVTEVVRGELAGYKAPRLVVFTESVPRGPNGKADAARAKALLSGGGAIVR